MGKFKIGDRIKAKDNAPYSTTTNGWEGIVVRTADTDGIFKARDITGSDLNNYAIDEQFFDLINNQTTNMTTKFKIGDIVKYVSNRFNDSSDNPLWEGNYGRVKGKIMDIESGNEYRIEWGNGITNCGYMDDDIELINPIKQFNKTKGMKNLAAAAKALKRNGPKTDYMVYMQIPIRITAADAEDAMELAKEAFEYNNMDIVRNNTEDIIKVEVINIF